MTVTVEGIGQEVAGEQRQELEMLTVFVCVCVFLYSMCLPDSVCTHSVDRECSVSKAPGFIEVIWLS